MSRIFISVISHRHAELIQRIDALSKLAKHCTVVLKSNVEEPICSYCEQHGIHYLPPTEIMGFGKNNNNVFDYCLEFLGMEKNDIFVILNPDVDIQLSEVVSLSKKMDDATVHFSAINLFKNYNLTEYDDSIRKFPNLLDFILNFTGKWNRNQLDKSKITRPCIVDWAAGSFLAVRAWAYQDVSGFDTKYFMYCEDIDICYRLKRKGIDLYFYPEIKAVHQAQFKNRSLFTRHFFWHVKSAIIFSGKKFFYELKEND